MIDTTHCPSGKQTHSTRDEARDQLVSMATNLSDRDIGVYKCKLCGLYHVGHTWHRGKIRTTPEYKAKRRDLDLADRSRIEEDEA